MALIDRGYNQPATLVRQGKKGVCVVLRYNPHSMNVYDERCQKVVWSETLKKLFREMSCACRFG